MTEGPLAMQKRMLRDLMAEFGPTRSNVLPFARPDRHHDLLHWLLFDDERRVVGCQCGFRADVVADEGHGDSVVHHLIQVGVQGP